MKIRGLRATLLVMAMMLMLGACGSGVRQLEGRDYPLNPLPSLDNEDPFAGPDGKTSSATFQKFFLDSVNYRSQGRWTGFALQAQDGFWSLSDYYFSAPRAWEMSSFEPNQEAILTSVPFTVPGGRKGIKLGFQATWEFMPGHELFVEQRAAEASWQTLASFDGSNPALPDWNRYTIWLPDTGASDDQWQVRFRFQGNALNEFGSLAALDNIAVYQTRLAAPSVWASDGTSAQVPFATAYWTAGAGGPRPDFFDIYERDDNFGNEDWTLTHSVPYGNFQTILGDDVGTSYYVKIKARKEGYQDSEFSNEAVGYAHDPLDDFPF